MSESDLQANILLQLSRGDTRLIRVNAGHAWAGKVVQRDNCQIILSPYHPVHLAPEGTADLLGPQSVEITAGMVGTRVAVFSALELKYGRRQPTSEQLAFLDVIRRLGGRAGVARSVEEARAILEGRHTL